MSDAEVEAAARGDIPERHAMTLGVVMAPGGDLALVLLGTDGPPGPYPYQVLCRLTPDGWEQESSSNGSGWTATATNAAGLTVGVETAWGRASRGETEVELLVAGVSHRAPVRHGYYLAVEWDVPDSGGATDDAEGQASW
jgi:hypothetical protein